MTHPVAARAVGPAGGTVAAGDLRPGWRVVLRGAAARSLPGGTLSGIVMAVQVHGTLAMVTVDTADRVVKVRCGATDPWQVLPNRG